MMKSDFFIAGIGASAGGHEALREFFSRFPPSSNIAFVLVTHLLRDHLSILDKIVSRFTDMEVRRIQSFERVRPGVVYVLPENSKVFIKDGVLILRPREDQEIINRNVDIFFQSLAEDQKEKAIGIVFSGMGSDGGEGVKTIHEFGGTVLVQEPGSTAFRGMPETAIKRDSPDEILPPGKLAEALHAFLDERQAVRLFGNPGAYGTSG